MKIGDTTISLSHIISVTPASHKFRIITATREYTVYEGNREDHAHDDYMIFVAKGFLKTEHQYLTRSIDDRELGLRGFSEGGD